MALLLALGRFFHFHDPVHSWYDSLGGGSAHHKASTYTQDNISRINTEISMAGLGFEPTAPVFERVKTVHALDRAATMPHMINR
jgi:hypothetical protein